MFFFLPVRGGTVGWGNALQGGRTQFRFRMESLEFFIYKILSAVRWHCDRNSLQLYWVPETFRGEKGGWCLGLTTLPILHADCTGIWNSQTPGTLWVRNRNVLGMLYLTFSNAALLLQTSGSQIWSYGPRVCHANFLRGQNIFWVGNRKFNTWMKYFKFKTKIKIPFSPTCTAVQKINFNLLLFPHPCYLNLVPSGWLICCLK
jgi:hypothetical protein